MNKRQIKQGKVKLNVGDFVRIGKQKRMFAKGYEENFTTQIFKVLKVIHITLQPLYQLVDLNNEHIKGKFYNYELVRVQPGEFKIEKILKTRRTHGLTEYYVRWKGYSKQFDSWVKSSVLKKI